jgi:sulfite reductase beta subunit-like hemoprotein
MINIVTHLEKRVAFDRNVRINMNGCPNGCAQHAIGDIGLQGCKARVEGKRSRSRRTTFTWAARSGATARSRAPSTARCRPTRCSSLWKTC